MEGSLLGVNTKLVTIFVNGIMANSWNYSCNYQTRNDAIDIPQDQEILSTCAVFIVVRNFPRHFNQIEKRNFPEMS